MQYKNKENKTEINQTSTETQYKLTNKQRTIKKNKWRKKIRL
jgi:hypothetical protein